MLKLKLLAPAAALAVAISLLTGCAPQSTHPNQINSFDGASFDSMTLAHAALSSLRTTVTTSYPQYKPVFNQAVAAYQVAFTAYSTFREKPATQSQAALAISNLTVSVVDLENAFQSAMHAQPAAVQRVRARAVSLRAANPKITISDILSELEIAAAVAASIPGTQPYSTIAQIVIQTTQSALQSLNGVAGQPIDLSTLPPIAPIA